VTGSSVYSKAAPPKEDPFLAKHMKILRAQIGHRIGADAQYAASHDAGLLNKRSIVKNTKFRNWTYGKGPKPYAGSHYLYKPKKPNRDLMLGPDR